ncbi:MAG: DMT family transporter [Ancalomicrobiaceae bacterium]|nr:DMT family transporter [Ancalomicrobiaceae bacterium]
MIVRLLGPSGTHHLSQAQLGALTVFFATVAWSSAGFFTRLIPVDAWTLMLWRGFFGGLTALLFVYARHGGATAAVFRSLGVTGWLFGLINGVGMVAFLGALRLTTVAHVTIIYATMPLAVALAAWVSIGEKPTLLAVVASLVAAAGVALTIVAGQSEGNIWGDALALVMTASIVVALLVQRTGRPVDPIAAAVVSGFFCMIFALPMSSPLSPSALEFGELALYGAVNIALGLILFFLGARHIPATTSGLIGALDTPLAPLWVWLAFGETPRATTLFGGIVVVGAVVGYLFWSMWDRSQVGGKAGGGAPAD